MYHFEFVGRETRAPVKDSLLSIIREAQALLRNDIAFRYYFVGSDRRDMVTRDPKTNTGYDFDVNLEIAGDAPGTPREIKARFMDALNRAARKYGYDRAEDSTRVITIKWKDRQNSRILHSCDFAIVRTRTDGEGPARRESFTSTRRRTAIPGRIGPNSMTCSFKRPGGSAKTDIRRNCASCT